MKNVIFDSLGLINFPMCSFLLGYLMTKLVFLHASTGWNDKIVVLKKRTVQLYFKTLIEQINSGNLIM